MKLNPDIYSTKLTERTYTSISEDWVAEFKLSSNDTQKTSVFFVIYGQPLEVGAKAMIYTASTFCSTQGEIFCNFAVGEHHRKNIAQIITVSCTYTTHLWVKYPYNFTFGTIRATYTFFQCLLSRRIHIAYRTWFTNLSGDFFYFGVFEETVPLLQTVDVFLPFGMVCQSRLSRRWELQQPLIDIASKFMFFIFDPA